MGRCHCVSVSSQFIFIFILCISSCLKLQTLFILNLYKTHKVLFSPSSIILTVSPIKTLSVGFISTPTPEILLILPQLLLENFQFASILGFTLSEVITSSRVVFASTGYRPFTKFPVAVKVISSIILQRKMMNELCTPLTSY